MINKLLSLFPRQNNKTYDLGKLQNSGFIKSIEDLSGCPNCKSKNITWKFFIPIGGSKSTIPSQNICNDCGYKDEEGLEFLTKAGVEVEHIADLDWYEN